MTPETTEKLRATQQRLRDGIDAVQSEQRQAEDDMRTITSLRASVHERMGKTRHDSPAAEQLIADLARLQIAEVWLNERIQRQFAVREKLVSTIRGAGYEVEDLNTARVQPSWTAMLNHDTALDRALQAVSDIEARIAFVAPPEPAPEEERWFTALAPRVAA
ncbi:MAG TPA: hypothetical protein VG167_15650 [Verrucomicrobiae bacterium]|nr:hypothetical protein [Verrucomicrobiae bacterium]